MPESAFEALLAVLAYTDRVRIAYCTPLRLPSERAYGRQVSAVAEALHALGHAVHLYVPTRKNPITEDFWRYHDVDRGVALTYVPAFDGIAAWYTPGVVGLKLHVASYVRHLLALLRPADIDVLYTRSPAIVGALLKTKIPVVVELHAIPRFFKGRFARQLEQCALIVCLTSPQKDELVDLGVPPERIVVEPDGVDLASFAALPDRAAARSSCGLPEDARVVAYAGSLTTMGHSKGPEQLLDAARLVSAQFQNLHVLIAGGPDDVARRLREEAPANVHVLGQLPFGEVPRVYAAADVLVYTAPASDHPYFRRDTSPLKIFEYMAAGRPIVCADLPPLHDILDADTAVFYRPGDVQSLAGGISWCFMDEASAGERARRARQTCDRYAWTSRMERIVSRLA